MVESLEECIKRYKTLRKRIKNNNLPDVPSIITEAKPKVVAVEKGDTENTRLWIQYMKIWHPRGYNGSMGRNIKFLIEDEVSGQHLGALSWGFFSDKGKTIEDVVRPGKIVVLDFSGAGELPWNVRITLTAILAKKMYSKRAFARSKEEIRKIERGEMHLMGIPLIWLFLDEAHIFVPTERGTAATEPLLEWVRQGRRPGLSLVLATQQPGALDPRVLSQCDILIIHRLTAGVDSQAIGSRISEIHGAKSVIHYMKRMPKEPGYAIVMDDQTEEVVPILVRPRQSWHAGESAKLEEYMKLTQGFDSL